MDQLTNKEYDELKMQLDVLAGIIADMDEANEHILDVASEILRKIPAVDTAGILEAESESALYCLQRMSSGGESFDDCYPALCDAVDKLQRAAEHMASPASAGPQAQDPVSVQDPDPVPELPESVFFDEPDLDSMDMDMQPVDLSPADTQDLLMTLDIIGDLLEDMGEDNEHLKSVLVDMFQKIASISGLPAQLVHSACATAADLEAGRTAFDQGVNALRGVVHRLRELACDEPAPPPASAAGAARAAAPPKTTDIDTFLEMHPPLLDALEQELLNAAAGGAGALGLVKARIRSLIEEYEKYNYDAPAAFLWRVNAQLQTMGDALSSDAVTALLNARDILFDAFDASDGEEVDAARAEAMLAKLNAAGLAADAAAAHKTPAGAQGAAARKLPEINFDPDNPELAEFVSESMEYLQSSEVALLELEKNPANSDHLNEIFRCFHNIKGISGFMSLNDVNELAHTAESLMDQAREGKIEFIGPVAQAAFEALDMLRIMAERIDAATSGEPYAIPDGYLALIERLGNPWGSRQAPAPAAAPAEAPDAGDAPETPEAGKQAPAAAAIQRKAKTNGSIKVNTSRLDQLIDSVGELVISNSMVIQEPEIRDTNNARLSRNVAQLAKITRELQELAMSMRMVSLKATFQKMARLARDLSVKSRVPVEFTFSGEDTELDRNVVEEIGSPLVHMVRNAVDHGIEKPDDRRAAGKPEKGRVQLRAFHEGGNVIIKIQDDGHGLNKEKILAKAENLGLIDKGAGAEMSSRDIYGLIFHPGFSTADKVTDVSGRGVGMDVVKRSIENLRGRIEIQSEPGKGTTFIIRLPLTLAIIDGMVVTVGGERYIVPTIAIVESLRPEPEQIKTVVGKGEMLNLRGELLPLFRLYKLFRCDDAKTDPSDALVVVVAGDGSTCALLVDELVDQQQVVIKSLGKTFDDLEGVSGGAIMGDGKVALILDAAGLVRAARGTM